MNTAEVKERLRKGGFDLFPVTSDGWVMASRMKDVATIRLAGDAEAAAIRAKGEALKENRQLVELTAAEKWNGVLPTTMTPNGTVPFVKVGQ